MITTTTTPTIEMPPAIIPPDINLSVPILSLIERVQAIQQEHRLPTLSEQQQMSEWMGWGPVAPAFEEEPKGKWAEIGVQLRMLLGPQASKTASNAITTSYFTSGYLIDALWQIALGLGFDGGRVLEAGCGSGSVLAAAPRNTTRPLIMTGIEQELFSAQVAQLRVPDATIHVNPLEKVSIVNGSYDLAIGNVPFSSVKPFDPSIFTKTSILPKLSLHNYFLYRILLALRPGGIAAFLTSRFTLDALDPDQRAVLARIGIFLGAIRLPSNAHKAAGTQVITDIVVFQRRSDADEHFLPYKGEMWSNSSYEVVPSIKINSYYQTHPQYIVGTPILDEHGMYKRNDIKIVAPDHLESTLSETITDFLEEMRGKGWAYIPPTNYTEIGEELVTRREDGRKEGTYFLQDEKLFHIVDGRAQPYRAEKEEEEKGESTSKGKPKQTAMEAEITLLVRLKDTVLDLLDQEKVHDRPDTELQPLRDQLNALYDQYHRTYGPIHRAKTTISEPDPETGEQRVTRRRPMAMSAFSKDPDYPVVLGLEHYDQTEEQASKALIFTQRVNIRPVRRTHADSPDEALALCLDEYGHLDLEVIAGLLDIPHEEVATRLGDLIYQDPKTLQWQTANAYLSGNVRIKLREAQEAAKELPDRFTRNVTALAAIQPEESSPEEITAMLGVPWVDPKDIEQFCMDLLKVSPIVSYEPKTATWEVLIPPNVSLMGARINSEWGTRRMDAFRVLEVGLNKRIPIIYDQLDKDTHVKNTDETMAVQEKLDAMSIRFSEWIWEESDRAKRTAAAYNELFHSTVTQRFDGSHLSFPGMNPTWAKNLYSWQRDFVYRMTATRGVLCGHPVGAGKTTTEIAGAMTLRRLGFIQKAAIVVPNHLLEQITAEAQRLYPAARILMISRDDLAKDRRKLFAARVAMGDYDFVVMTHSGLQAIRVHSDTENAYLEKKMATHRQIMFNLTKENAKDIQNKRTIKKIEHDLDVMKQQQTKLLTQKRDAGVTFEQMGISYLIIDEAHFFKNLGLFTNVPGLQSPAAKRSVDLEMKLRWLEEHNEGRPFAAFFSATPISNSMVEAFVMAWYLNMPLLEAQKLVSVDAFASTFIEMKTGIEVSPDGSSFRMHTRPGRFVNLMEFRALLHHFADIRDERILDKKRPKRREHIVAIDPSPELQKFVNDLVARNEEIHNNEPREMYGGKVDNMLWVTTDGRAAALDLSLVKMPCASSPKLEAIAASMCAIYERNQTAMAHLSGTYKSLQIGFCDLGTPSKERGEQVYGKVKKLLIAGGIPASAIRYVHEAKNAAAKELLFAQCRRGQVAILLGSTELLGTGTNIQFRCAAIHHFDAPWKPDMVKQREGRAHRPGNQFKAIDIYRYVTRRSFDAYSWQILTNKAVFTDQFSRQDAIGREMDDLGDTALSYGQVKAAATGDPLVLEQAELDMLITKLQRLYSMHMRARKRDAEEVTRAQRDIGWTHMRIKEIQKTIDQLTTCEHPGFRTMRHVALEENESIGKLVIGEVQQLLFSKGGTRQIGTWNGTPLYVQVGVGQTSYTVILSVGYDLFTINASNWISEKQQWRFAAALENMTQEMRVSLGKYEMDIERYQRTIEQYTIQAQQPFMQLQELQQRIDRKAAIDTYTAMVAGGTKSEDEIASMRKYLMADAPDYSALLAVKSTSQNLDDDEEENEDDIVVSTPPALSVEQLIETLVTTSDEEITALPPSIVVARGVSWDELYARQKQQQQQKKVAAAENKKKKKKKEEATPTPAPKPQKKSSCAALYSTTLWGDAEKDVDVPLQPMLLLV